MPNIMVGKEFWNKIMELLNENSLRWLATQINVSPHTMQGAKQRLSIPKADTLQKIAELYDVSVEWLLTGNEDYEEQEMKEDVVIPTLIHDKAASIKLESWLYEEVSTLAKEERRNINLQIQYLIEKGIVQVKKEKEYLQTMNHTSEINQAEKIG